MLLLLSWQLTPSTLVHGFRQPFMLEATPMPVPLFANLPLPLEWHTLSQMLRPALWIGGTLLVALTVRRIVLSWLQSRRQHTTSFINMLLDAMRAPSLLWCFAATLAVAIRYARLSVGEQGYAVQAIVVFLIISITLMAANITRRSLTQYGERYNLPFAVAGLSRTLAYVVVVIIGVLTVLAYLKLDIRPILAALGVGGLAVALALQDTLANLFAGVHILVERPIQVGDFVRLSTNEEGTVTDIGWRTTRIASGPNTMVVIPNTKITTGSLTNYSLPTQPTPLDVPILVGLAADAAIVQQIALEEAQAHPDVLPMPTPVVLFDPGVTQTHLQFKLSVSVPSRALQVPTASALRLRLLERFRQAQVPLPASERLVLIKKDSGK